MPVTCTLERLPRRFADASRADPNTSVHHLLCVNCLARFSEMNSAAVHGAVFAVGALVGGGIATAVVSKRQIPVPPTATFPSAQLPAQKVTLAPPIIQMGPKGDAHLVTPSTSPAVIEPVLKYGNPGERATHTYDPTVMRKNMNYNLRPSEQRSRVTCGDHLCIDI